MPGSLRKRPELGRTPGNSACFSGRDTRGGYATRAVPSVVRSEPPKRNSLASCMAQDFEPEVPSEPETVAWNQTTTINDAIEGWKQNGWEDLSPVTVRRYENVWKVHIEKSIGKRRIATLTPYEVERYFRKLKADGAGRETVRYVRSVLNRACRLARKWSNSTLPNPIAESELPDLGHRRGTPSRCAPRRPKRYGNYWPRLRELDLRFAACLTRHRRDRHTPGRSVRSAVVGRRLGRTAPSRSTSRWWRRGEARRSSLQRPGQHP